MLLTDDILTQDKDVELGGNVTLRCVLKNHHAPCLVAWQKETDRGTENMAVYNETTGGNVFPPYKRRIGFAVLGLSDTAITFWNVSHQEDGCYSCVFFNFPLGPITGKPCLSVYGKSFLVIIVSIRSAIFNRILFLCISISKSQEWGKRLGRGELMDACILVHCTVSSNTNNFMLNQWTLMVAGNGWRLVSGLHT